MSEKAEVTVLCIPTWRITAARVVEELFRECPESLWDDLLDFRQMILHQKDWAMVLDSFRSCRRKLEDDHYLPFYRLRKILVSHLRLENANASLESLLRKKNFCFRRWQNTRQQHAPHFNTEVKLVEFR